MDSMKAHAVSALAAGKYELTGEGILVDRSIKLKGTYIHSVNGQEVVEDPNLIPDQGLLFMLDVALGAQSKAAGFYLAPFSGGTNPAAGWTAANFAATASEITSAVEGFSNVTRPQWVPAAAAAGLIDNTASLAVFNVVCTTSVTVTGAALLTSNVRGGTSGYLISASKFATARILYNTDVWDLGYRVSLLDS